jgi:polyhydroxyalkanoate synthase
VLVDALRRMQGDALGLLGFGPSECRYRIIAAGSGWRLRCYGGGDSGPPLLIVAAPIKRPYIWDLGPSASVVRRCLREGLRVYLLEWLTPSAADGNRGLEHYAGTAINEAVGAVSKRAGGAKPVVIAHSLGGTLAAIFASAEPSRLRGLVLLASPLCFAPGSSPFRDALVKIPPATISPTTIVPGSLLSQLSAMAAPETFVWSRLFDAALSFSDPRAAELQGMVERWTLDELSLPGQLVTDVLRQLYAEDRFCRGKLQIGTKTVGPSSLRTSTLTVVNTGDEVAPPRSILPFVSAMQPGFVRILEYPGENGVGLQHLAPLIGRCAHASLWPEIMSWLRATSASKP